MNPKWIVTLPGGYQGEVRELSRDGVFVNVEALEDILDIAGNVEVKVGKVFVTHKNNLSPI